MSVDPDFQLKNARILIIGLGLMGGSMALALKGKCARVFGVDKDEETLRLAKEQAIVDEVDSEFGRFMDEVNCIILATPVDRIMQNLREIGDLADRSKNYILLDLGSTKKEITELMDLLPINFDPIGCHPVCGKENLSIINAERTLYFGAPFLVTKLARTTNNAHQFVIQLTVSLGAKPIFIDPESHDTIMASVSHLPYLLSSSLVVSTSESVSSYIGPGYRSTSRLAGTSSSMMMSIIRSNRENILKNLESFIDEIRFLTSVIQENDEENLKQYLDSAKQKYNRIIGSDQR